MQNREIAPIQTRWRGYRFRSRLEARWAVFFDALHMEFEYEPEGWNLPISGRYLPDFFLPHINTWAEVKPKAFKDEEAAKCRELAEHQPGCVVLLLDGAPQVRDYEGFGLDCGIVDSHSYRLDIFQTSIRFYRDKHYLFADHPNDLFETNCSDEFRRAIYASRNARFEGEELL